MIKEYNQLIHKKHMHMEQVKCKNEEIKCINVIKQ